MKIKEQTRKLAAQVAQNTIEVADRADRGLKRFSKSIKSILLKSHIAFSYIL
ncbi:chlorohydrolase [Streptococcus pneumoniae]|uniref:chlorohydrolase n=1 Tax=Streptococcus pneumoniae TaxID=1313 RepID=UPI000B5934A0|nr:chlorohydrolase [Streptococcus pneumoniae]